MFVTHTMEVEHDEPYEPTDPWDVPLHFDYTFQAFSNTDMTPLRPYLGPSYEEVASRGPGVFERYLNEARAFLLRRAKSPPEDYDERSFMFSDVTGMFILHDIQSVPWADIEAALRIARDIRSGDVFSTEQPWRKHEVLGLVRQLVEWRVLTLHAVVMGLELHDDTDRPVVFRELEPHGQVRDTHGTVWTTSRNIMLVHGPCYTDGKRLVLFGPNAHKLLHIADYKLEGRVMRRAVPDLATGAIGQAINEYLGEPVQPRRVYDPAEAKREAEREYLASLNAIDPQRERHARLRKVREWDDERWAVAGRRYANSQGTFERQFDRFMAIPQYAHKIRKASDRP